RATSASRRRRPTASRCSSTTSDAPDRRLISIWPARCCAANRRAWRVARSGDDGVSEEGVRRNLGRGLSALLGAESEDYASLDRVRLSKMVPIQMVHPGPVQPRHHFDEEQLKALADSIRQNGILQPLVVRRHPSMPNAFEIVAGERRWRAAQLAQLHEVPIIIKELSDSEALELALVENVQRQD